MPETLKKTGVLSYPQAAEAVEQYCRKLKSPATEAAPILQGLGRILAEPVVADRDFPPFSRATRDGYAVRAADLGAIPASLRVAGEVKAGSSYEKTVLAGEAVEIMTGAPVPAGADAVVMVEYTQRQGNMIEVQRACVAGENVVPAGSEARQGRELLPRGIVLGFSQIAVAAATGQTKLQVYKKPRVAILSTGDELVDVAQVPGPFQIRNSNSYSLAAQVMGCGGQPTGLPIASDELPVLRKLIAQALTYDLLLLSGGVSMGKFDLVEQVLGELGATFFFTGALIQPGKPVVFGELPTANGTMPFFGLPGNPVSTMVTFDLFVRPVVQGLSGGLPVRLPVGKARLRKEIVTKTGLVRFLPASLQGGIFDPEVELVAWQGSGDLAASAGANCYVVVPADRESLAAGEMVSVLLRSCPN